MTRESESYINVDLLASKYPLPDLEKSRNNAEDFITDLVAAGNRIRLFLNITAKLIPENKIDKLPQGILLGHMVRLAKLYDSFLILLCNNQSEASMLIGRAMVETSINLKFLALNINDELCDKFVKSSLSYDKKLYEYVQNKVGEKEPKDFEKRILAVISDNFSKTRYKIEDINYAKDHKWTDDLLSLSRKVDLIEVYETLYRLLSRAEHGSWQHLEHYNLKDNINMYKPELALFRPEPQVISNVSFICLAAAISYLDYISVNNKTFKKYLAELLSWLRDISNQYNTLKDQIF